MKNLLSLLIIFLNITTATAQSATEIFSITTPSEKISNSLYKKIKLVDVRPDPQNLGIVQLGAFNRKARVVTETPLADQLSGLLTALTDSTAQARELFLLLRQLSFAEVTGAMSERGYFQLRAILFAKKGEGFHKLAAIDTVVVIKAMDVTKGLLRQGTKSLTELLAANLTKEPADGLSYLSDEVVHFDQLEKKALPLYTADSLRNGIYKTFHAFTVLQPDEESFTVDFGKNGNSPVLRQANEKGKMEKVSSKDIYAFVHEGRAFIATDYGYYPLRKQAEDFYFTGKAKVAANNADVMMASLFFGVVGGLIASGGTSATFEMKVDHLSGGFIRIKEAKNTNNFNDAVY
jgi:hypothetical protein